MTEYRCSECGSIAVVTDKVIKSCQCNAAVVASATAKMRGQGGLL